MMILKLLNKLSNLHCKIFQNNKPRLIYRSSSPNHPIYVYDNLFFRWLNFGNLATQSKVCKIFITRPVIETNKILELTAILYTAMNNYDKQSNNQIKNNINILFLGLGGGDLLRSFARLFYKYQLNITAVELSSEVILVANKYFYLDKISKLKHINLNFMHDNAFDIISHDSINNHDIIIVDFFTELNSTLNLLEESYIASLYKKINQNGIIAFNVLVSDHDIFNNFINIINKYFGKNIFILNSEKLYNQMIFIFKDTKYINYLAENTDNKILSKYCTNIRPSNKGFVADF